MSPMLPSWQYRSLWGLVGGQTLIQFDINIFLWTRICPFLNKKKWKLLSYRLWLLNKNMALKMSIGHFRALIIFWSALKKCIFTNFRSKLCIFLNESNYVCFDLRRAPINKTTKLRKQKRKKMNEWKPKKNTRINNTLQSFCDIYLV